MLYSLEAGGSNDEMYFSFTTWLVELRINLDMPIAVTNVK